MKTVCGLVRAKGGGVRTPSSTQDLLSTASELLVILLANVPTDLSRVPTAQAIAVYNEMSETLGVYQSLMLTQQHQGLGLGGGGMWADEHNLLHLVGVLETFLVTLSLVVGEDVRIAQAAAAAAVGHGVGGLDMGFGMNMNMGMGIGMEMPSFAAPGSVTVSQQSSSDMDAVTLGLVLNHMVCFLFCFVCLFFLFLSLGSLSTTSLTPPAMATFPGRLFITRVLLATARCDMRI